MADDYDEKYTRPQLRRDIKAELMASDKGGRPGQWSARKSQMLVQEYERRGGGYLSDRKDEDARSLERWTAEQWQTAAGSAYASEDGRPMKRYLPAKAWDLLSDDEKEATDRKKRKEGEEAGRQFVANTLAAKAARAYVTHGDASELSAEQLGRLTKDELLDVARDRDLPGRSRMTKEKLAAALHEHFRSADPARMTRDEMYGRAKEQEIPGRSTMSKDELADAVAPED